MPSKYNAITMAIYGGVININIKKNTIVPFQIWDGLIYECNRLYSK